MKFKNKSPGRFIPFLIFLIISMKQNLTVYTLFILSGGKNMKTYFPLNFQ